MPRVAHFAFSPGNLSSPMGNRIDSESGQQELHFGTQFDHTPITVLKKLGLWDDFLTFSG